jgi:mannitol-specific phosphotransferase system IIBC component
MVTPKKLQKFHKFLDAMVTPLSELYLFWGLLYYAPIEHPTTIY